MNFDYLQSISELSDLYRFCHAAEVTQVADPENSAINSRKALEWIVRAIYAIKGIRVAERTSLLELLDGEPFKEFVGNDKLMMAVHYIRKVGNSGAHTGNVTRSQSFFALLNIYNFVGEVFVKLGCVESYPPFNKELIPCKPPIHAVPTEQPIPSDAFVNKVDVAAVSKSPLPTPDTDISEAETRKLYIDLMLQEAGWEVMTEEGKVLPSAACVEIEVFGMPNDQEKGFCDYVLFGQNGVPLAVVEAKRTSKSPTAGIPQDHYKLRLRKRRYQGGHPD